METLALRAAEGQQAQRATSPSGTSATEPMLALRGRTGNPAAYRAPGRNAACRWRACFERADVGIVGRELAQERFGFDVYQRRWAR
jgi:hypothetical protein